MKDQVTQACEPKRQADVYDAFDNLTRNVDVLKGEINELVNRLMPVSADAAGVNKGDGCEKERISSCELSKKIREIDYIVKEIRDTVVTQIKSLEI